MTDRYEQFKKWFKTHPTDEDELDLVFAIGNLFCKFEEYEKTTEIRERLKTIIRKEIDKYTNSTMDRVQFAERLVNRLTDQECLTLFKRLIGDDNL